VSWHDEDSTRPNSPSARLRASAAVSSNPPPAGDVHELLGQVMASVARLERKVNDLIPLSHEVHKLRQDLEHERHHLVHDTSAMAARKSSNRMALIVGGLFGAYEAAAPFLRELWRLIHK
jgi:hypothetical protein